MKLNIQVTQNKTFLTLKENNKTLGKDELANHDLFEKLLTSIDKLVKLSNDQPFPTIQVTCAKKTNNLSCNIAKVIASALNLK